MFTPKLIETYKSSKSTMPLRTWVNIIGKNLPQFKNDEDIFNPVPINIKMAPGANGSVRVAVSPSSDWYKTLVNAVEKMTGKSNISIVSYVGKPIQGMEIHRIAHLGECDIIDNKTGKVIRMDKIVPPPLELSTNKIAQLKNWWNDNREVLSTQIASELKGLTMAEIAAATVAEGPVFEVIDNHIRNNTLHGLDWPEFTKTFGKHIDSKEVAGSILESVRQSLIANEKQIRDFHASDGGSESSLWKKTTVGKNKYKDDFTMFRDVVEDAVYHPMVGQKIIQSLTYGKIDKRVSARGRQPARRRRAPPKKMGEQHPVSSYYKLHYKVHGKLPGHVIEGYNKGRVESQYTGDSDRAIDMFNLYSGRAVTRKPLPELVPIEMDLPELVPIESKLPELVPILPELVPIEYIDDEYEPKLTDFL
jgi:hypothetical protein